MFTVPPPAPQFLVKFRIQLAFQTLSAVTGLQRHARTVIVALRHPDL